MGLHFFKGFWFLPVAHESIFILVGDKYFICESLEATLERNVMEIVWNITQKFELGKQISYDMAKICTVAKFH